MTYFIEDLILVPVTSEIFIPQIELIRCSFVVDPLPMSLIVLMVRYVCWNAPYVLASSGWDTRLGLYRHTRRGSIGRIISIKKFSVLL